MKRIFVLIGAAAMFLNAVCASGQETNVNQADTQNVKVIDKSSAEVITGDETEMTVADESATTVKLGKRTINIFEDEDGSTIKVSKAVRDNDDEFFFSQDDNNRSSGRRRFKPHWSGFEFGLNNYLAPDYNFTLPAEDNFMDLNSGKSWNYNFNFAQLGIGLTRHFGLVTGLGFEFNNYHFNGNNNIIKDDMGNIVIYDADLDGITLKKSKFSTTYFTVPLMLELQIPVERHNTINIAGGIIGGAKVYSRTKMVYFDDGGKEKVKSKSDFSLNYLRWGPTARLGYENFQIYATYYMNGLFKKDKGPELYPFQVGLAFTID